MKIEGRNAVLELLKTDKEIEKILMEKGAQGSLGRIFAAARQKNVRVQFVERAALDRESVTGRHQGVIALAADYAYSDLEDIIANKKDPAGGFVLLCDGMQDVHNLGSVLRVAECAGADGVVIPKTGSAQVNESVLRISEGAAEHVRVARVTNLARAIESLQAAGYWVYGLEADGEDIYGQDLTGSIALVVGGEDSGLKRLTREKCDKVLSLPMYGEINSLNASVALGAACYEAVRQRR